jgi:hypothetical protein
MGLHLMSMRLIGMDLMHGSHRHASGELSIISLNDLCAKLPAREFA